ncbi:MAG: ABC transporter permease [Candidatus Thorarchaeota archaeon]|nr:ABC transporter permease [Candidatus Thorarchaeota archaeon]
MTIVEVADSEGVQPEFAPNFQVRSLDWSISKTIATKNLRIALRYPANIIVWGIIPLLWIAPYLLMMTAISGPGGSAHFTEISGYDDFIRFAVIGWFVYQYVDNSIWGIGNTFRWEQFSGTLEPLFLAPVPRISILLGGAFSDSVQTTFSALVLLGFSMILFGVSYSVTMILPVIIVLLLMLFALFGFGFMLAGLIIVFKDPSVLTQLVDSMIFTVTPVNYPVQVLPKYAQILAYLMPATLAIEVIRELAITGEFTIISYLLGIAGLVGLLILFWGVGLAVFRYAEHWTKERGSMGGF